MAIRPTIYIGLGGTGIKAIAQTKKLFEEEYGKGNIPSRIAFMAVDFDLSTPNNSELATDISDDFFPITTATSPRKSYIKRSEEGEYKWFPPTNAAFLGEIISDGAGMVRSYGRFLTEMIIGNLKTSFARCWEKVNSIEGAADTAYSGPIDVHIAMSLSGGTGCGSFLNVAHMIRESYGNRVHLIGYGVLHGVFRAMDPTTRKTPRVISNSYSAILDLDYLMSATSTHPIKMELNGHPITLMQPIYDNFFVVDNVSENGKVINHINKLSEVIGTCLYVSGDEMGAQIHSGLSNTSWRNGAYDILHKKGWMSGLGACQVVYKGAQLAEIYADKAAGELIRQMQNAGADAQQEAVKWTEEVGIREDGDTYDMLIDSIYTPKAVSTTRAPRLNISDTMAATKAAVAKYLVTFEQFPSVETIAERKTQLTQALQNKVDAILQQKGAVANALAFLHTLQSLCEKYKNEMSIERDHYEDEARNQKEALETKGFMEYETYCNKWIKTAKGKEQKLEDAIIRPAIRIKKTLLEAERRKVAYEIFVALLNRIGTIKAHVEDMDRVLTSLAGQYAQKIIDGQSNSESSLVFEYDLSTEERLNMTFKKEDVDVAAFARMFGTKLFDMDLNEELHEKIETYVRSLPQVATYLNRNIVDVLDELSNEEYKLLKQNIVDKSSRLLQLDDRGQVNRLRGNAAPTEMIVKNYMISIYKPKERKCRLESDSSFLPSIDKTYISNDNEAMRQKILFYRADMSVIPYCIRAFDEMTVENEYQKIVHAAEQGISFNPHFDLQLYEKMKLQGFKLEPEMQNEAMFYWVCGSLFGWKTITEQQYIMEKDSNNVPVKIASKADVEHTKYICCLKGKYYYWNEEGKSTGKLGKWTPLGDSSDRQSAFNYFKTVVLPQIKVTLKNKIVEELRAGGKAHYKTLIENLAPNDDAKYDYIDLLICADKNSATYYTQAKGEHVLLDDEWEYIREDLWNTLDNL